MNFILYEVNIIMFGSGFTDNRSYWLVIEGGTRYRCISGGLHRVAVGVSVSACRFTLMSACRVTFVSRVFLINSFDCWYRIFYFRDIGLLLIYFLIQQTQFSCKLTNFSFNSCYKFCRNHCYRVNCWTFKKPFTSNLFSLILNRKLYLSL